MSKRLGFTLLGAFVGFVIGFLYQLTAPDGFSCIPSNVINADTSQLYVKVVEVILCYIIVSIATGIGALAGNLLGSLN